MCEHRHTRTHARSRAYMKSSPRTIDARMHFYFVGVRRCVTLRHRLSRLRLSPSPLILHGLSFSPLARSFPLDAYIHPCLLLARCGAAALRDSFASSSSSSSPSSSSSSSSSSRMEILLFLATPVSPTRGALYLPAYAYKCTRGRIYVSTYAAWRGAGEAREEGERSELEKRERCRQRDRKGRKTG